MSMPRKIKTIEELLYEIGSAMSALHMYDTIEPEWENDPERLPFIDEKYEFAKHAMQHLSGAAKYLVSLTNEEQRKRERRQHIRMIKEKKPVTTYYVIFLDDGGRFYCANKSFWKRTEAESYAKTVAPSRNPQVVRATEKLNKGE